ncbi:MAG: hypothetical protein AB7O26_06970 [Planctomycetaceae bacterium]
MFREVWLRAACSCCLMSAAFIVSGCGKSHPVGCYSVEGQVLMDDKPLYEARVVFHPLTPLPENIAKPIAVSDEQGKFSLTTFEKDDGAPPGEYAITVEYRELRLVGEEEIRDGRDLLDPMFSDPKRTSLKYEVIEGKNDVPPLKVHGPVTGLSEVEAR